MSFDMDDVRRLGPKAQEQIAAKLAVTMVEARKMQEARSKYGNKKTVVETNGTRLTFDSRKEARRFDELSVMLRAGIIRDLKLQPQFTLQEAYTTPEGVRVRAIRYQADFSYWAMKAYWRNYAEQCPPEGWNFVVEDVKSRATRTRAYAMKKKLMQERFGITIEET